MKHDFLTDTERRALKVWHRKEKDRRLAGRLKVVLHADKGWTYRDIAEALFLEEETVRKHVDEFKTVGKLEHIHGGGSESKLSPSQTAELVNHLDQITYTKAAQVCDYVQKTYSYLESNRRCYASAN
ncbi:MAG: helix-turn-helix domain-containing protein [Holosporales bacterium]|jgi:transposase|nr:helix-turn-helix domain-containing protein [Holosporales bacterium]